MKHFAHRGLILLPLFLGLLGMILVTRFTAQATPVYTPLVNPPWATNVRVNMMAAGTAIQDTPPALAASRVTNDLYAAWPSYSSTGYADVYVARSINGGTTWGVPQPINAVEHGIDASAGESPALAVSGSLTVHVIWRSTPTMYLETLFYNRSIDGGQTWGTDRNLIQSNHYAGGGIGSPDLVADQAGRLYVAWATTFAFPANYLGLARSLDVGVSWVTSTAAIITSPLGVGSPALTVDVTGTLHLAWEEITSAWPDPNGRQTCYARSANSGQTWTNRQCIGGAPTTTTLQTKPDVAVDPFNGRVHVVWQDDRSGADQIYHVSSGNGGDSWGTPTLVSGVFTSTTEPAISVVADGVVYVVWQDAHNGNDDIYYARSTDGGQTWSAAGRVNDDSEVRAQPQRHPVLVAATDGPRVAWNDFRTVQADIYATSLVSTCAVPLTGVRVSGASIITPNVPLALTANITPSNATLPVSYNWSPVPVTGQGTTQASYSWSTPGHYTVTASASNCGGTFSVEQAVEVLCLAPLTAASIQGPTVITAGTPAVFNAIITPTTPGSPVTYAWSPAPNSGQGTLQAHYLWQDVGTRVVTFTAANCGGTFAVERAITIHDDISPTYASFTPSGWVTTTQTPDVRVQVTDAESGLNVSSGQYATSIDGGANWSGWSSAAVSGANYVTTPQTLTVSALPFGHDTDVTHQYRVHFRISDMAGHVSASSNYAVNIDTAPPTNPAVVINGSPSSWINRASVAVTLTGATDPASGLAGYLTYWNQNASTVPDPGLSDAVWTAATNFSSTVPGDGKDWYLHVRSLDTAGNWASGATHAGPYWFDITPPTAVTYYTSTPAQGVLWHHNTIYVRWSGGTDYVSQSGGYAYLWDTAPTSTPDPITQTLGTSTISPALPDATYYFHIRARDVAGNWTPTAHFGPFKLDSTPPTVPVIISSNPGLNVWTTDNTLVVTWAASYDAGGISGYAYQWDNWPNMTPNWITQTAGLSATSTPLNDGTWYFHIAARDLAGQWSPVTHYGPVKVDANPPTNPALYANHAPQFWSWNPVITETWSGASDGNFGSGVYGYSFVWDASASTLPPATINTTGTTSSRTLSDGAWYFHLRTRDVSGLWASTAVQQGPFYIDANPPTNPTSFTSDHTPGVWSTQSKVTVTWSGAVDGSGSGVEGYSVTWDNQAATLPPMTISTYGNTSAKDLFHGSQWYVHVRTRDKTGNWAATAAHYGPFYIDYSTPHCTAVSPNSSAIRTFTVNWSGQSAWSGVAGFDVAYRDATAGSDWQDWQANVTYPAANFAGQDGHVYEFRCRARSNSGVVENWPNSYQSRTGVATVDFEVIGLELTQAVQDLNNSTWLIEGKRTFARLHVRSRLLGEQGPVTARLTAWRNGSVLGTLVPNNNGAAISIRMNPNRGMLDQSFYFDLPLTWVDGHDLTLKAEVNAGMQWAETDYGNNVAWAWAPRFWSAPAMNITLFDICYIGDGVTYHISDAERFEIESWLRRLYPVAQVNVQWAFLTPCYNATRVQDENKNWTMTYPTCETIDQTLTWWRTHDPGGQAEPAMSRSYGMVSNAWAFMRGCSLTRPAIVASGPSWPPVGSGLSKMGSAWYASHELGHDYAQPHTLGGPKACVCPTGCCGCEGDAVSRYPEGRISPTTDPSSPNAMYGFDIETLEIYPPTFKDNMTYCDNEWISDYTTYGIQSEMSFEAKFGGLGGPQAMTRQVSAADQEYLAVFGTLITETDQALMEPFYRIPTGQDTLGRVPGEYSLRLLDANDDALADYPFTIKSTHLDPGPSCSSVATVTLPATISEWVPWITGTRRIALLHGNTEIFSRFVTTNTPQVTVTFPNSGEVLAAAPFTLTWAATDADGDPLNFTVDYSQDGGAHWKTIGSGITTTQFLVDGTRLAGAAQGKFRIIATDGVNTGRDDSDGTFALNDKTPVLNVTSPDNGVTYLPGQNVAFVGSAVDLEDGTLPDAALTWTSSLSGMLGTGHLLHNANLVTGTHIITLTAIDSTGHTATATRTVRISTMWRDVYLPVVLHQ